MCRTPVSLLAPLGLTVALLWATPFALGQSPPSIDRVEEDWELVIASPSTIEVGPQITTTMSPLGDNSQNFFAFNLNYRDNPFIPGGLQVCCFVSGSQVVAPESQKRESCQTTGESIAWTQRLSTSGGVLSFGISNGQSVTWSQFGQGDNLDISVATGLSNLNSYNPSVSVANSGVGWQSNRVQRMTLCRIRYYSGNNLIYTDETPRQLVAAQ